VEKRPLSIFNKKSLFLSFFTRKTSISSCDDLNKIINHGKEIQCNRTANLGYKNRNTDIFDYTSQYRLPNNGLNMQKVIENFQIFMKKEYNTKDRKFLERDGRLIFLAFMRPILNGAGYDFKEPQTSEEKRLDVVITYHQHQYVAELKLWYGPAANAEGLLQLADYLDRMGLDTGYLLIFDHSQRKSWKNGWTDVGDKRIFWAKV
jgi:hypothetical protein